MEGTGAIVGYDGGDNAAFLGTTDDDGVTLNQHLVISRATGNVGIGTTSPGAKLDVYSTGGTLLKNTFSDNTSLGAMDFYEGSTQVSGIQMMGSSYGTASRQNNLELWNRTAAGDITFHTNSVTPDVTIQNDGNVGIGTTGPGASLEVTSVNSPQFLIRHPTEALNNSASLRFVTGTGAIADANSLGGIYGIMTNDGGALTSDLRFLVNAGDSEQTRMTIQSSGNVGIGTTSPGSKLEVHGTTSGESITISTDANANPSLIFKSDSDGVAKYSQLGYVYNENVVKLVYGSSSLAGNTNGIVINSNGNVGIGTTSPEDVLHLATASGNTGIVLERGDGFDWQIEDSGGHLYFNGGANLPIANLASKMVIQSTGNVGIGTTDPQGLLDVRGSLCLNGGADCRTTWPTSGDLGSVDGSGTANYLPKFSDSDTLADSAVYDDGAGNVGIGTTSPGTKLDIVGGGNQIRLASNNNDGTLKAGGFVGRNYDNDIEDINIFNYVSSAIVGNLLYFGGGNSEKTAATKLFFFTAENYDDTLGNARMTIDNNGNVGIGTTSPSGQLHITGSDTSDQVIIENTDASAASAPDLVFWRNSASPAVSDLLGRIDFRGENSASEAINYSYIYGLIDNATNGSETGALRFFTQEDGVDDLRMAIVGSNVGIGTTSPGAPLHLNRTTGPTEIRYSAGNYGTYWENGLDSGGFHFQEDGTTKVYFQNGGNIGIGTTSPTRKTEIMLSSSSAYNPTSIPTATRVLQLTNDDGSGDNALLQFRTTNNAADALIGIVQGGSSNNADLVFITDGDGGLSEKMRIQNDGNVGIGTTSPGAKLDVNGVVNIDGLSSSVASHFTANGSVLVDYDAGAADKDAGFRFNSNNKTDYTLGINNATGDYFVIGRGLNVPSSVTQDLVIDNTGNVGIGTTSPGAKLDVNGGDFRITDTAPAIYLSETAGSADENWDLKVSGGKLFIQTNDDALGSVSTKATFQQNGNVGIGTTSPDSKLTIDAGTIKTRWSLGADRNHIQLANEAGVVYGQIGLKTSTADMFIGTDNDPNLIVLDRSSGNIGIGTTSPGAKLEVAGTTAFTPSADQARLSDSTITVGSTIVRVAGSGGAVILDTDPAIADGATDGQMLILQGTSDTNTVQIADAVNTALAGGGAFVLGKGDTLTLIWDSGDSLWYETARSDN